MYVNEHVINKMQDTLKLAGDATRLKILFCLLDELDTSSSDPHHLIEKCVNDIALQIGCSQSLVSHQLKTLKDADLVGTRKEGTKVYYFLKDKHVRLLIGVAYDHVMEEEEND